jgi:hypothetical protein
MSTARQPFVERPRVICEVSASKWAEACVEAAIAYCRRRNAELILVWVLEPRLWSSSSTVASAGIGTWGLVGAMNRQLELARNLGVTGTGLVRIGEPRHVLEAERDAHGAERVFSVSGVTVAGAPERRLSHARAA